MARDDVNLPNFHAFDPVNFTLSPNGLLKSTLDNIYSFLARTSFHSWLYDDFFSGATAGNCGWSAVGANSGTIAVTTANANNVGLIRLSTATGSATAQSALRLGVSQVLLGTGRVVLEWKVSITTLSTSSEEFSFRCGLLDSTTGEATDGVYFCYDRATDGNFWSVKTAANTSVTKTVLDGTSGNPTFALAAGTFFNLVADISADASTVDFYGGVDRMNMKFLKQHTTNIPSGAGRQTSPCAALIKSVGTLVADTVDLDWYWQFTGYANPR